MAHHGGVQVGDVARVTAERLQRIQGESNGDGDVNRTWVLQQQWRLSAGA